MEDHHCPRCCADMQLPPSSSPSSTSSPPPPSTDTSSQAHRRRLLSGLVGLVRWWSPVVILSVLARRADGCSTRPSPKPRPPRPFWHPNENLPRQPCTDDYAELYCLHNGTCFMQLSARGDVRPYCECASQFYGRRCEFLEVSIDKWLPITNPKEQIETAAISVAVTLIIFLACLVSCAVYVYRKRQKQRPRSVGDLSDGGSSMEGHPRPFSIRRAEHLFPSRKPTGWLQFHELEPGSAQFAVGVLETRSGRSLCSTCDPSLLTSPPPSFARSISTGCPNCMKAPMAVAEEVRVKDSVVEGPMSSTV